MLLSFLRKLKLIGWVFKSAIIVSTTSCFYVRDHCQVTYHHIRFLNFAMKNPIVSSSPSTKNLLTLLAFPTSSIPMPLDPRFTSNAGTRYRSWNSRQAHSTICSFSSVVMVQVLYTRMPPGERRLTAVLKSFRCSRGNEFNSSREISFRNCGL